MPLRVVLKVLDETGPGNTIYLTQKTVESLKLEACNANVKAGQLGVRADIRVGRLDSRPPRLIVSRSIMTALSLSDGQSALIWWDAKGKTLRLGPVVGILGCRAKGPGVFGQGTEIIRDCVRAARRGGCIAYAFKASDIDWETNTVKGRYWSSRGLKRGRFPLPDVVYDRLTSRAAERSSRVQRAKQLLLELPGLSYYNRSFLNKWDVHGMLEKYPDIRKHLPPTESLTDIRILEKFLRRYAVVFVKPVDGSLGASILRIARTPAGYATRYTRLDKPDLHGKAKSLKRVLLFGERYCHRGRYIVQKGIRLARINGGPFDVRVLLQKSINNRWVVHSMVARVAQPGNVVSNLADGGQIINPRKAISLVFGRSVKPSLITLRMRRLAKRVALAIEKEIGFEFAEMGIDLGLDTSGRIWVIEANSRPGRQTNEEKGPHRIPGSVVRLMRFVRSRGMK